MAIYLGTDTVSLDGMRDSYMFNGHLKKTYTYSFNLGQTNYSSITPTTSNQTLTLFTTPYTTTASTTAIVARIGANYDGTILNRFENDYYVFCSAKINYAYSATATAPFGICSSQATDQHYGKSWGTIDSSTGKLDYTTTPTYNHSYITSAGSYLYQKSNGTFNRSTGYGVFCSRTNPTSYGTNNGEYLNLVIGLLMVRYGDSYCTLDSLSKINPTQTIITYQWDIYEGSKSAYSNIFQTAYGLATLP